MYSHNQNQMLSSESFETDFCIWKLILTFSKFRSINKKRSLNSCFQCLKNHLHYLCKIHCSLNMILFSIKWKCTQWEMSMVTHAWNFSTGGGGDWRWTWAREQHKVSKPTNQAPSFMVQTPGFVSGNGSINYNL